jgi:hypothetical protein
MLSNEHEHEQLCFVCYRVVDMPSPRVPSVQWPCAGCDAPIWVPKKSPVALPKNLYSLHRRFARKLMQTFAVASELRNG